MLGPMHLFSVLCLLSSFNMVLHPGHSCAVEGGVTGSPVPCSHEVAHISAQNSDSGSNATKDIHTSPSFKVAPLRHLFVWLFWAWFFIYLFAFLFFFVKGRSYLEGGRVYYMFLLASSSVIWTMFSLLGRGIVGNALCPCS